MIAVAVILVLLALGGVSRQTDAITRVADDVLLLVERGPEALRQKRRAERFVHRVWLALAFVAAAYVVDWMLG